MSRVLFNFVALAIDFKIRFGLNSAMKMHTDSMNTHAFSIKKTPSSGDGIPFNQVLGQLVLMDADTP